MHVFYTPDIQKCNELPEEEAAHAVRVLRLQAGDEVTLTDGNGNFYRADQYRHEQKVLCQHRGNTSATCSVGCPSTHSHGTHQEYGPHRMVCRKSY